MATYYVSNEASNGYIVGNDTTGDGSAGNPWLTIEKSYGSGASGDTVYVNGTAHTAATVFTLSKGITYLPTTDYGVTLKAAAGQSQVISITISTAVTATFGKFIIDSENDSARRCVLVSASATKYGLTFTGTKFYRFKIDGIRGTAASMKINLTCTNVIFESTTACQSGIRLSTLIDGDIVVDGATATMTFDTDQNGVVNLLATAAGYVGVTASIKNITAALTGPSSGSYWCAKAQNIPNVLMQSNTATMTASGSTFLYGFWICAATSSSRDASGGIIRGCTVTINGVASGEMCMIGNDSSGAANNLQDYGLIETCFGYTDTTGAGGVHGMTFNWSANGVIRRNYTNNAYIGVLFKGATGGYACGNIVNNAGYNYGLRAKGATSCVFANNTIYLHGSTVGNGLYVDGDTTSTTASTGVIFDNNIVYADVTFTKLAYVSPAQSGPTAASTATFSNNLYYSTVAVPSAAFTYQSTSYDTIAAWAAAKETSALTGDPKLYDVGSADFRLNIGSAAIATGTPVAGIKDYTGKRYNPSRPDVGAYVGQRAQTRSSASARTARS
jgi:hypothetical protein